MRVCHTSVLWNPCTLGYPINQLGSWIDMGKNAAGLICYVHICLEPNFQLLHPLHCWVPFHPPGEHVRALYQSMEGGWLIPCWNAICWGGHETAKEDLLKDDEHALEILEDYFAGAARLSLGKGWPPYGPNNHDMLRLSLLSAPFELPRLLRDPVVQESWLRVLFSRHPLFGKNNLKSHLTFQLSP